MAAAAAERANFDDFVARRVRCGCVTSSAIRLETPQQRLVAAAAAAHGR